MVVITIVLLSAGAKVPSDRPIDGVDQTDVLLGKSESGKRDSLLSFIGGDLVAARCQSLGTVHADETGDAGDKDSHRASRMRFSSISLAYFMKLAAQPIV